MTHLALCRQCSAGYYDGVMDSSTDSEETDTPASRADSFVGSNQSSSLIVAGEPVSGVQSDIGHRSDTPSSPLFASGFSVLLDHPPQPRQPIEENHDDLPSLHHKGATYSATDADAAQDRQPDRRKLHVRQLVATKGNTDDDARDPNKFYRQCWATLAWISSNLKRCHRSAREFSVTISRYTADNDLRNIFQDLARRLKKFPIVSFYRYLWTKDRSLLFSTFFVNYIFPIILEALPWYLNRRRVSALLRDLRNRIQHSMIAGEQLQLTVLAVYILMTLVYSILMTLDTHLRNKVNQASKLVVRRLIMERLLYSEIGALKQLCNLPSFRLWLTARVRKVDTKRKLQSGTLESQFYNDISATLNLFNFTIPQIMTSGFTLYKQGAEIYSNRLELDLLACMRPFLAGGITKILNEIKHRAVEKKQKKFLKEQTLHMTELVQTTVDGLVDIQSNNLQKQQLVQLDTMIKEEIRNQHSLGHFATRAWNAISGRNMVEFVTEVLVVHKVMQKGVSHEQYRKLQLDIDYTYRLFRKTYGMCRSGRKVLKHQKRVKKILNLPNFLEEEKVKESGLIPFKGISMRDIRFSYDDMLHKERSGGIEKGDIFKSHGVFGSFKSETVTNLKVRSVPANHVLALNVKGEITFLPGQTYAVCGPNRSGKSTLISLICKVLHLNPETCPGGVISINGIDYKDVSRIAIRDLVAYMSQKPFIFPGTVRDNIKCGNPDASEADVIEAARAAGLFSTPTGGPSNPDENSDPVDNEISAAQRTMKTLWKAYRETFSDQPAKCESPLDTVTEARGANMSGGFVQSVALARVFLKKSARVIILDEAMGQMDAYKKREVILPRLFDYVRKRQMTLIVVSHNPDIIKLMDHIYVLEAGRLRHQGSHDHLLTEGAESYLRLIGLASLPHNKQARAEVIGGHVAQSRPRRSPLFHSSIPSNIPPPIPQLVAGGEGDCESLSSSKQHIYTRKPTTSI